MRKGIVPKDNFFYTRAVEVFLETAKFGSFSKAAKSLGVSQSSISQVIAKIEQSLGFNLFERDCRPMRLTKEGQGLFDKFFNHRREMDELINEFRQDNHLHPTLSFGMIETVAVAIAVPLSSALRKNFSQVRLQCTSNNRLVSDVENGVLELAVVASQEELNNRLHYELLYEEPWVLLFPSIEELNEQPTWRDLLFCGIPHLFHERHTADGVIFSKLFEQEKLDYVKNFELDNMQLIYKFVEEGLGWALIPGVGIRSLKKNTKIRFLQAPKPIPKRRIYLVTRDGTNPRIIKDVKEAIKSEIYSVIRDILPKAPWIEKDYLITP